MKLRLIASLFVLSALSGCVKTYEFSQTAPNQSLENTRSNKAQVVFIRPSGGIFSGLQAIVFDTTNGQRNILGVTPSHSKFAKQFAPGEYQFVASNGLVSHAMKANLRAGKRYYVLVRPVYGKGFQLRPLIKGSGSDFSQQNPKFAEWKQETEFTSLAPGANEWFTEHNENVEATIKAALDNWKAKTPEQQRELTLRSSDWAE